MCSHIYNSHLTCTSLKVLLFYFVIIANGFHCFFLCFYVWSKPKNPYPIPKCTLSAPLRVEIKHNGCFRVNKYYFNFLDIKAGCYAFGGALKERKNWTLQQCDIDCCQGVNCNTRVPTLSKAAFTVFAPTGNTKKYNYLLNKIIKSLKCMVSSYFRDDI